MSLTLHRLRACRIDPIALEQSDLLELPEDTEKFMIDPTLSFRTFVINDYSTATPRFYAISYDLVKEFGDAAKEFIFVPFCCTPRGPLGLISVYIDAYDSYNNAIKQAISGELKVLSIARIDDTLVFTEHPIEHESPITNDILEDLLEVFFDESIIDSREHLMFIKYATPLISL